MSTLQPVLTSGIESYSKIKSSPSPSILTERKKEMGGCCCFKDKETDYTGIIIAITVIALVLMAVCLPQPRHRAYYVYRC